MLRQRRNKLVFELEAAIFRQNFRQVGFEPVMGFRGSVAEELFEVEIVHEKWIADSMNEQRNMLRRLSQFYKLLDRIRSCDSVDPVKIVELRRDVIFKKRSNQNKKFLEFGVREIFENLKIKTANLQNSD